MHCIFLSASNCSSIFTIKVKPPGGVTLPFTTRCHRSYCDFYSSRNLLHEKIANSGLIVALADIYERSNRSGSPGYRQKQTSATPFRLRRSRGQLLADEAGIADTQHLAAGHRPEPCPSTSCLFDAQSFLYQSAPPW
jgi:hypothetical protein